MRASLHAPMGLRGMGAFAHNGSMASLALIALDGPSGVGKSTTAKAVAARLGWDYLDSGAMYRSVALALLRAGFPSSDSQQLSALLHSLVLSQGGGRFHLNGEDVSEAIRAPEVTALVSPLSALPAVREVLLTQQRRIGGRGNFVVDGRDIGTVVFPHACCKVFLTASVEARAHRRFLELQVKGLRTPESEVAADLTARDLADSTRAVAPLKKAEDAWELDSSTMTLEEVADAIVKHHQAHGR